MIWDSLTSDFQLEIIGDDKAFKIGEEHDGVAILHFIMDQVNPLTTTGALDFKDETELKKVADFGDEVKLYHMWIAEPRTSIIKKRRRGNLQQICTIHVPNLFDGAKTKILSKQSKLIEDFGSKGRSINAILSAI